MPIPMPTPVAVANMIGDLVGRDVAARSTTPAALQAKQHAVAVYRDVEGGLKAVACCDLALGGSFAAAMTVIPLARVDEGAKTGKLDDGLTENLYEVFNVLSAIFPKAGMPRLILRSMHTDAQLEPDVAALFAKPVQRLDMDVTVSGYRSGRLTLAVQ